MNIHLSPKYLSVGIINASSKLLFEYWEHRKVINDLVDKFKHK